MSTIVKLRPWTLADLNALCKYGNNPNVANNLMNRFPHPYTWDKGMEFISNISKQNPREVLAIEYKSQAIGAIGLHPQEDIFFKNAELGYWIAEDFWGKGIMKSTIQLMLDYAFSNFDFERIFARPFGRNLASQKVLEKCGFTLEAKLYKTIFKNNQYEDEWIYSMRRENYSELKLESQSQINSSRT
ncbi:MAG: GNAT family protein [Saprospiraceae bacterium]